MNAPDLWVHGERDKTKHNHWRAQEPPGVMGQEIRAAVLLAELRDDPQQPSPIPSVLCFSFHLFEASISHRRGSRWEVKRDKFVLDPPNLLLHEGLSHVTLTGVKQTLGAGALSMHSPQWFQRFQRHEPALWNGNGLVWVFLEVRS